MLLERLTCTKLKLIVQELDLFYEGFTCWTRDKLVLGGFNMLYDGFL